MGDETIKKVAVIINGDNEIRHLENVDRALKNVLIPENYETYVVSPYRPSEKTDHYFEATTTGVSTLLEQLKVNVDSNTEVVIYTTGHGLDDGFCLGDNCQTEHFLQEFDSISKGATRRVVMDQCYGGRFITLFTDDPKSLFISGGSRGETDICQEIAPRIWASAGEIPDRNGDNQINWQERFDYAVDGRTLSSMPQFTTSEGYPIEGKAPFPAAVSEISDEKELIASLNQMRPGQYAVITFSAEWCGPCKAYKSVFERFAVESGGRHLFLRTENEELGKKWGVLGFPTVIIVSWRGSWVVVNDRNALPIQIAQFEIPSEERAMAYTKARKEIEKNNEEDRRLLRLVDELAKVALETKSVTDFEKSISVVEKILNPQYKFEALFKITGSLSFAELDDKAAPVFKKLISLALKIWDLRYQVDALRNITLSVRKAGLEDEKIPVFKELISAAEKIRSPYYQVIALLDIADQMTRVGLEDESLSAFEKSISAAEKIDDNATRKGMFVKIAIHLRFAGLSGRIQMPKQ